MDIMIETVRKLELQADDVLHVVVGCAADKFGPEDAKHGPWIPGPGELEEALARWQAVVPDGVKVIATHFGEEPTIIRDTNGVENR